jgi:site-specific DNA recombinase
MVNGQKQLIPAYEYIRVSTGPQAKRYGPALQHDANVSYAERNGLEIIRTFRDVITGTKESRYGLDEMLALAPVSTARDVITYATSRVGRYIRVSQNVWHDITEAGYTLHSASQGKLDHHTQQGRTLFAVSSIADQLDYENTVAKLYDGRAQKAAKGGIPTRFDGYGWKRYYLPNGERVLEIDPDQIFWLNEIVRWALMGESCQTISQKLNDRTIATPSGFGRWYPRTVHKLLTREANTGKMNFQFYKGNKSYLVDVPQLMSVETFEAVQVVLEARTKGGRAAKRIDQYPLTGLVKCGHCLHNMAVSVASGGKHQVSLRCIYTKTCDHRKMHRYSEIESIVRETIAEAITNSFEGVFKIEQPQATLRLEHLQKQLVQIEKRRANLLDMAEYGTISPAELKKRLAGVASETSGYLAEIQQLQHQKPKPKLDVTTWEKIVRKELEKNPSYRELLLVAGAYVHLFADKRVELHVKII